LLALPICFPDMVDVSLGSMLPTSGICFLSVEILIPGFCFVLEE